MATTRLRKAFRYPTDGNDNEPAEGIDEEEQETLISLLKRHDAESTAFFVRVFLAFPLLSGLTYLPSIISPQSSNDLLFSVLGLVSLACTAFMLHITSLHNNSSMELPSLASGKLASVMKLVRKSITPINAVLCTMLAFEAWQRYRYSDITEPKLWSAIIPSIVFVMSFLACSQLRPVDMSFLERMRYGYKGA